MGRVCRRDWIVPGSCQSVSKAIRNVLEIGLCCAPTKERSLVACSGHFLSVMLPKGAQPWKPLRSKLVSLGYAGDMSCRPVMRAHNSILKFYYSNWKLQH